MFLKNFFCTSTLLLGLSQAAYAAQVLDFEDLYPGYDIYSSTPIPANYQGLSWSDTSLWVTKGFSPVGTIGNVSLHNRYQRNLSFQDSQSFTFKGAYITAVSPPVATVTIEGYADGILKTSQTITTRNTPQWFNFNFADVDTIRMVPKPSTNPLAGYYYPPGEIAIDNITLSVDEDNDGINDSEDQCPATPAGETVDNTGCSINQLVPCSATWENHGQYVSKIARLAKRFAEQGLITEQEKGTIVSVAVQSSCGT